MRKALCLVATLVFFWLGIGIVIFQQAKIRGLAGELIALDQLRKETLSEGSSFRSNNDDMKRYEQFEKFDRERHGGHSSGWLYQREVDHFPYYLFVGCLMWVIAAGFWLRRNKKPAAIQPSTE